MSTRYHRLYRTRSNYAWWRPLLAVILAAALALSLSSAVGLGAFLLVSATEGAEATAAQIEELLLPDAAHPLSIVLALLAVAVWLPAIFLSLWAVGLKPVGMLSSVAFRLRWRLLGRYAALAFVTVSGAQAVGLGLAAVTGGLPPSRVQLEPHIVLLSLIAVVVLVPFQAAAEEYAFRGILVQALGSWIRNPVLPVMLPTLLFTVSHSYNLWGLLEVLALGIVAGWLTIRTGGLEAAIALHVLNNVLVFGILLSGIAGTTRIEPDTSSPVSFGITAVMLLTYFFWVTLGEQATRAHEAGEARG